MLKVTMTSKGRVTIPKVLRERHHLKPGVVLEFIEGTRSEVILRKTLSGKTAAGAKHQSRARR